ncbi:MAG TPA: alpha/beta hydrolase [Candidatus Nitrosocosmicus sp.]|nr:alpha/beta hydrolase [Candidatus Nitrosocosmicus sp.]
MNSNSVKDNLRLLTMIATMMLVVIFVVNSNSTFNLAYATSSSSSSSSSPFSNSIEQTRQELQSSINNQVQKTITDTIKDINKNTDITNSSSIVNNTNSNRNSELGSSNSTEATKKVRVGDIDIAYRIFGKGDPILLIPSFSMPMDGWDQVMLNKLSTNHTVIIFDNRGIGNTTLGNNETLPSIHQFANDTAGFLDAIGIKKPVDVLGYSMGGYIAQELALTQPQKVNRLILIGTDCGVYSTTRTIPSQITPEVARSMDSGNFSVETFASIMFPTKWLKENTEYALNLLSGVTLVSKEGIYIQNQAASTWTGTCDRLSAINKPTLVIVGTDDIVRPPQNSVMLAQMIPGAWLVQMQEAGHGVMYQYPEKFTEIVEIFLSATP